VGCGAVVLWWVVACPLPFRVSGVVEVDVRCMSCCRGPCLPPWRAHNNDACRVCIYIGVTETTRTGAVSPAVLGNAAATHGNARVGIPEYLDARLKLWKKQFYCKCSMKCRVGDCNVRSDMSVIDHPLLASWMGVYLALTALCDASV